MKLSDDLVLGLAFKKINRGFSQLISSNDLRDAYDVLYALSSSKTAKFYSIYSQQNGSNSYLSEEKRILFKLFDDCVDSIEKYENKKRKIGRILTILYDECFKFSMFSNMDLCIKFLEVFFLSREDWSKFDVKEHRIFVGVSHYFLAALYVFSVVRNTREIEEIENMLTYLILEADTYMIDSLMPHLGGED